MTAQAARVDRRLGEGGAFDAARVRALAIEVSLLAVLTAATAAVYVWTKAPLYNPFRTIDPWLYTALWTNFDQIYASFPRTYYVSRLPWILPGYALNGIFDARTAALVLHTTYFLGGGVLFYVLCRRWLGVAAAAMGYVALIGCQMYFNAHRWDYQEGGVLTYMIGAYAFALVRTRSSVLRPGSLALGGFFAAAMVTTRIIDVVFLLGIPLLYAAVNVDTGWAARLKQFVLDFVAFAVGAVTLLVACGLFARAHGEEFLFFMPQVRVVRTTSGGYNQIPVDLWLPFSPHVWAPLFVVVFAAVVLVIGPKGDRLQRRVLVAATGWLGLLYAGFAAWQFLGEGWFFNLTYYFSSFLVPTVFCLSTSAAVVLGAPTVSRRSLLVGIGCVAVVLAPVVWIYRTDSELRAATAYRDDSYIAMFVLMGIAIAVVILARLPRLHAAAAVAVVTAFLAVSYGVDASYTNLSYGGSDPRTGGLYDTGQKFVAYLRANGYQKKLPNLWYDENDLAGGIRSVQSLYYYAFTFLDNRMPAVDGTFQYRMSVWQPKRIVLLCVDPRCKGAATALGRAGYKPWLQSHTRLESDGVRVWVLIYRVDPTPA
jgi:hypothetical protein